MPEFDMFYERFAKHVDINIELSDYKLNPYITNSDYFGKFKWDKFTVYHQYKFLINRRIIFKIVGEIKNNNLILNIHYPNFKIEMVNAIVLTLFSILLIFYLSSVYGFILLLINVLQILFLLRFYKKRELNVYNLFDEMTKEKNGA